MYNFPSNNFENNSFIIMTYFHGISEILSKKIVILIGKALTDISWAFSADLTGDFNVSINKIKK